MNNNSCFAFKLAIDIVHEIIGNPASTFFLPTNYSLVVIMSFQQHESPRPIRQKSQVNLVALECVIWCHCCSDMSCNAITTFYISRSSGSTLDNNYDIVCTTWVPSTDSNSVWTVKMMTIVGDTNHGLMTIHRRVHVFRVKHFIFSIPLHFPFPVTQCSVYFSFSLISIEYMLQSFRMHLFECSIGSEW